MADRSKAKDKVENPKAQFEKPKDIVQDKALSQHEKKKALNTWEQDERQLLTASNEGMPGSDEGSPVGWRQSPGRGCRHERRNRREAEAQTIPLADRSRARRSSPPADQQRCHCQRLNKSGSDEDVWCGTRRFMTPLRHQFPNQTKRGRGECIGALGNGNDEGDHPGHIVLDEFDLGNQRRQRSRVADAGAEQDNAEQGQEDVRAAREQERDRADDLNAVAGTCHEATVGAVTGISQPTSVRPAIAAAVAAPMARPANCAPSVGTNSENRCASSPIWAKSPSAIPADNVRNLRSRQTCEPSSGFAEGEVMEAAAAPVSIAVRRQTHVLRCLREHQIG